MHSVRYVVTYYLRSEKLMLKDGCFVKSNVFQALDGCQYLCVLPTDSPVILFRKCNIVYSEDKELNTLNVEKIQYTPGKVVLSTSIPPMLP